MRNPGGVAKLAPLGKSEPEAVDTTEYCEQQELFQRRGALPDSDQERVVFSVARRRHCSSRGAQRRMYSDGLPIGELSPVGQPDEPLRP